MSNLDDKIKDIFEGQHKDLPQGFWEDLKPNIPVYEDKERKMFGFPLLGCLLGSLALVVLIGGGSLYYFNNSSQIQNNIVSNNNFANEEISKNLNKIIEKVENSKFNKIANETLTSVFDNDSEQTGINITTIENQVVTTEMNNEISNRLQTRNLNDQNSTENDLQIVATEIKSNQESQLHNESQTIINNDSNLLNSEDEERENISNLSFAYVDRLNLKLEPNSDKFNLLINPVTKDIITPNSKGNRFINFGYNTVFAKRSISPSTRASWRSNKLKFERDYISHEVKAEMGYYISNLIYVKAGARFTRIQELFDYQINLINQETFEYQEGLRTIKHTNDLDLIDVTLGIGIEKPFGRFLIGTEITSGYNLVFKPQGIGFNDSDELTNIETTSFDDVKMYSNTIGLSLQGDLVFGYKFQNNIDINLNIGGKHYFNKFTEQEFPLAFNYKALHSGVSIRYRF